MKEFCPLCIEVREFDIDWDNRMIRCTTCGMVIRFKFESDLEDAFRIARQRFNRELIERWCTFDRFAYRLKPEAVQIIKNKPNALLYEWRYGKKYSVYSANIKAGLPREFAYAYFIIQQNGEERIYVAETKDEVEWITRAILQSGR